MRSFAQDDASTAPWQEAGNRPAAKSRLATSLSGMNPWNRVPHAATNASPGGASANIAVRPVSGARSNTASSKAQATPQPSPRAAPPAKAKSPSKAKAAAVALTSADLAMEPETVEPGSAAAEVVDPGVVAPAIVDADESEPFWDEDFSLFNPAPDDPVFHEGRDALIYDGKWNNRLNCWYAVAQVTLLHRQSPAKTPISRERVIGLNSSGQVVESFPRVQEARVLHFGVSPGMRTTIGRNLFTDIVNRQHSIEFTFLGLNHWRDQNDFYGGPGSSSPTQFVFPGLYSGFPLTQGGFNEASLHQLFDSSSMNNYELNYRVGTLPRPDRAVQLPNGRWARCGTPCILVSGLVGFRAVTIDEHFLWLSSGSYPDGGGDFSGSYKIDTSNNLFGAQIGGDAFAQYNLFSLGIRGKVGVYGDAARRSANIVITDPQFGDQSASFRNFTNRTSCVADLNFIGTVRLTQAINFRVSYDFMWCGGLINAPEQQQYNLVQPYPIVNTGRMLFQGVGLGIDAKW